MIDMVLAVKWGDDGRFINEYGYVEVEQKLELFASYTYTFFLARDNTPG